MLCDTSSHAEYLNKTRAVLCCAYYDVTVLFSRQWKRWKSKSETTLACRKRRPTVHNHTNMTHALLLIHRPDSIFGAIWPVQYRWTVKKPPKLNKLTLWITYASIVTWYTQSTGYSRIYMFNFRSDWLYKNNFPCCEVKTTFHYARKNLCC